MGKGIWTSITRKSFYPPPGPLSRARDQGKENVNALQRRRENRRVEPHLVLSLPTSVPGLAAVASPPEGWGWRWASEKAHESLPAGRGRLEQRLEPRRELARRRWAVLPCLSCLLCQLRGLRGTLCKLLLGVLDQSWLPGCAAQAVTQGSALTRALCLVRCSAVTVLTFSTLWEYGALCVYFAFHFVCKLRCWSCLRGLDSGVPRRQDSCPTVLLVACSGGQWWKGRGSHGLSTFRVPGSVLGAAETTVMGRRTR